MIMESFLILDIGAGTMDVLCYNIRSDLHYKAVTRSPAITIAEKAASLPGDLLVVGTEMGGGSLAWILKERAVEGRVLISRSASATLNHNPERVSSLGIELIEDAVADDLLQDRRFSVLTLSDLDLARLRHVVEGLDLPFSFDVVAVCAQDHGVPPLGLSPLDYRHEIFKASLEKNPFPHSLLYGADEIPETLTRLRAISRAAGEIPAKATYVMDSGMAAILGASMDPAAQSKERILTLDLATSHTVGAALEKGEIAGLFEYHTRDITIERLETLIADLAEGKLDHKKILQEGGHGAYLRKKIGTERIEMIIATGPKRAIINKSRLSIVRGSPLGDNMMTGTLGVLEAVRRREGLGPLPIT